MRGGEGEGPLRETGGDGIGSLPESCSRDLVAHNGPNCIDE